MDETHSVTYANGNLLLTNIMLFYVFFFSFFFASILFVFILCSFNTIARDFVIEFLGLISMCLQAKQSKFSSKQLSICYVCMRKPNWFRAKLKVNLKQQGENNVK